MNNEEIRHYCLSKPEVSEDLPFSDTALVFKLKGKMFALLDLSEKARGISLKCDPDLAVSLREHHPEVTPAWHFNKKHWNGVKFESLPEELVKKWIDHSYELVRKSLPAKDRF